MGFFEHVTQATPDAIFGLTQAYNSDKRAEKVNLTVGLYKTEELKTPILQSVKKAQQEILLSEKSKEYLPIDGDRAYLEGLGELIFGPFWAESKERIARAQTVGGTNALRVGGDLLFHEKIAETIHLPDFTWPNHKAIFQRSGFNVEIYPYYDAKERALRFDKMCAYLKALPSGNVVMLHACCQNPTGMDLSMDEWKELSAIFLSKRLIPFFDMAYQGFGKGLSQDAEPVRLFAREGHEMLVAYSTAKNFSLYAERAGALFLISESHKTNGHIASRLLTTIRPNYSNPPLHGAKIVAVILGTPALKKQWQDELDEMRQRVSEMRDAFSSKLSQKSKKIDFSFLKERSGLFVLLGLSEVQVDRLVREFAVYMTRDSRINVAGLNHANLDYVANSICSVL